MFFLKSNIVESLGIQHLEHIGKMINELSAIGDDTTP